MRLFILTVLFLFVISGFAKEEYLNCIPNGARIKGGRCTGCHMVTEPTDQNHALNNFGQDFLDNGKTWTQDLAIKDSDGDGALNDYELQSSGTIQWNCTDPEPTIFFNVANPGDPFIKPAVEIEDGLQRITVSIGHPGEVEPILTLEGYKVDEGVY